MRNDSSGRGFALPVAVFGLVVVGVLVTGGFYLARQETRIGIASERATAAFYIAERGANEVMAEWDISTFGALPNWGTATVADTSADGVWSVNVTRMTPRLYFLLVNGSVTQGDAVLGSAGRMLGYVARLISPSIQPNASLTTVGNITVGGSSEISGMDSIPCPWGSAFCDSPAPPVAGVLVDSLSNINFEGTAHTTEGDPEFLENNALTPDSLLFFGDALWDELVAMADKVYAHGQYVKQMHQDSVLINGAYVCETADNWSVPRFNWGDPNDPASACGGYFPVIYGQGDLSVESNDYGQGILLVEGDLTFKGGFEFYGPVIVRGTVSTEGTGGHFIGGLIAANVSLNASSVLGDAVIQYSTCSVTRAVLNSSLTRVRPLESRGWVDLSSAVGG
ncbi:MAG: hypothetical protein ACWGSQ_16275 [Longimicrobiales bacterium]